MIATKAFYKSKGFWGPLIALFALFAQQAGLGEIDQTKLLDAILTLFEWGGVALGFYGRVAAKAKLGLKDSQIEVLAEEPPKKLAHWLATFVAVLLAFSIAGCATASVRTETPGQALYALKADYATALKVVTAYRDDCEAKPAALRLGCEDHVAALQKIDAEKIWPALLDAKVAAGQSDASLAAANLVLRVAIRELRDYLLRYNLNQGAARDGPLSLAWELDP